jgi:hypothetical protein
MSAASPYVDQLGAIVRDHFEGLALEPAHEALVTAMTEDLRLHASDLTDAQRGAVLLLVSRVSDTVQAMDPAANARFIANLCGITGERLYHGRV